MVRIGTAGRAVCGTSACGWFWQGSVGYGLAGKVMCGTSSCGNVRCCLAGVVRCVAVEYGRAERGRLGLLGYATASLGPLWFGWAGVFRFGLSM